VTSFGNSLQVPPKPEELEISVFGPGFGECIVVHFGQGDWGIVDSCLEPNSKRPVALHYLKLLQVDAEKSVRFVLASHWHDDHMQGISSVFKEAKSALFACSQAVRTPEFNEILSSWTGTRFLPGGSGVDELHSVMSELAKRKADTRYPSPVLASANKVIWERARQPAITVKALSPSDAAVLATLARLKPLCPKNSKARRRLLSLQPNDTSVALALQIGNHRVLLGADLEARRDSGLGWIAVVDGFDKNEPKHQGFKIPHHGSPTAHHAGVWDHMLTDDPWAVTTPFVSGNVKLPSVADSQHILDRTTGAYLTAPPHPAKFRDSNKTVEKTAHEATLSIHFIPGRYGQVRIRKDANFVPEAPWNVELFGDALTMSDYVHGTH
jgi:hypothetical protein